MSSAEMLTRNKLTETDDIIRQIDALADRALGVSAADGTIDTAVTALKVQSAAIGTQADTIYTPLQIDPLA